MTTVMRRRLDQCVCSPRKILRSSEKERFSTGFVRLTTIASESSAAAWLCGASPGDRPAESKTAVADKKDKTLKRDDMVTPLERETGLEGYGVKGAIATQHRVVILHFHGHKLTHIISQSKRRTVLQSHIGREDRLVGGGIDVLIAEVGPIGTKTPGDLGIKTRSTPRVRQEWFHRLLEAPRESGGRDKRKILPANPGWLRGGQRSQSLGLCVCCHRRCFVQVRWFCRRDRCQFPQRNAGPDFPRELCRL